MAYESEALARQNEPELSERYFTLNGDWKFQWVESPLQDSLPRLPRLGMRITLPTHFTHTEWYGRGPHETYWDRKFSGKIGIHRRPIEEQFHRYPRPQETGNKTDLRWMTLTSLNTSLTVRPADHQLLSGSVWPFGVEELDFVAGKDGGKSASGLVPVTAKHGADIQAGNLLTWNIDHRQMGVGGDNSWVAQCTINRPSLQGYMATRSS